MPISREDILKEIEYYEDRMIDDPSSSLYSVMIEALEAMLDKYE